MRISVCKLRLHFPNSKHLRGLVCHDIFGNFFRHSEIFGPPPPPPPPPQLYMLATALDTDFPTGTSPGPPLIMSSPVTHP
jgi:hypothetical protein